MTGNAACSAVGDTAESWCECSANLSSACRRTDRIDAAVDSCDDLNTFTFNRSQSG